MRQLLIHDNNNNKNNNRGGGDNNNNASAEGATGGHNTTAEGEYFLDLRQLQPNPTPEGMGYNMLLHYTVALSRDGRGQGGIQSECECKVSARERLFFGRHGHVEILIVIRVAHNNKANLNQL